MMEITEKGTFLSRVAQLQAELKAPKGQTNKFGGYKYRSCEDILEAAKPLLLKYSLVLTISDRIAQVGERYYVCAEAVLRDTESENQLTNTAFAREAKEKKGMDECQVTGTASSYARKYALNGLLCIDDARDSDSGPNAAPPPGPICDRCGAALATIKKRDGSDWPPNEIAHYSSRRFGHILCPDCQRAALKDEKGALR